MVSVKRMRCSGPPAHACTHKGLLAWDACCCRATALCPASRAPAHPALLTIAHSSTPILPFSSLWHNTLHLVCSDLYTSRTVQHSSQTDTRQALRSTCGGRCLARSRRTRSLQSTFACMSAGHEAWRELMLSMVHGTSLATVCYILLHWCETMWLCAVMYVLHSAPALTGRLRGMQGWSHQSRRCTCAQGVRPP